MTMMAALSPRTSISGPDSSEIAQDFADSLKYLANNNKYEISNLTLVAKESTEHAHAISTVLEAHIRSTAPPRKLPALYVLDSIIKNVGTPYTVYLGANLYSTFMEAYAMVDEQVRRSMEAMLKTWREPVLGSMDARPVFPLELTRPIENALAKYKAVHMQQRPQQAYQNMPTPPPNMHRQQMPPQQYGYGTPQPQAAFMPPSYQQAAQNTAFRPPAYSGELDSLKRDLSDLINTIERDVSRLSWDTQLRQKLSALHELNTVLHSQQIDPAQLPMISNQIRSLGASIVSQPVAQPPYQWQPQNQTPQTVNGYGMSSAQHQQQVTIPQSQMSSLASLLSSVPKASTPQMRAAVPSLQDASHAQVNAIQAQAAAAPASNGSDLLAALTKAGYMNTAPAQSTPAPVQPPSNAVPSDLAALLGSLAKTAPQAAVTNKLDLTSKASLSTFRPQLLKKLYADRPSQCPQCGRRFPSTADGNTKKNLHLDWHFRINQRIAEGTSRGSHRNWYPNEMTWVKLVEFDGSTATAKAAADAAAASSQNESEKQKAKEASIQKRYVRAPAGMNSTTCSICYEEMRTSRPDDIQDWVFMNASINNGKIVHATCLEELQQGSQATPAVSVKTGQAAPQPSLAAMLAALQGAAPAQRESSRTPDSALGKRKAETEVGGDKKRVDG